MVVRCKYRMSFHFQLRYTFVSLPHHTHVIQQDGRNSAPPILYSRTMYTVHVKQDRETAMLHSRKFKSMLNDTFDLWCQVWNFNRFKTRHHANEYWGFIPPTQVPQATVLIIWPTPREDFILCSVKTTSNYIPGVITWKLQAKLNCWTLQKRLLTFYARCGENEWWRATPQPGIMV